jgi:FAD/FMN-containing dehydrogenase
MADRRKFIKNFGAATFTATMPNILRASSLPKAADLRFVPSTESNAVNYSQGYPKQHQRTPNYRAFCDTPEAAQTAIRWARDTNQSFATRSGGHCFMGFSQSDNLVLDTRGMSDIKIDADQRTVTVGAGVKLGPLYRALAKQGFALAGGTYGGVGIAGHTLGGGFGYRCRSDGLLIDQLVSLDMVLADGQIVTASANQNSDLFWACRGGGGGQFGVATSFKFKVKSSSPMHWISIYEPVGFSRAAQILFLWQYWSQGSPRHLATHLQITRRGDAGFLMVLSGFSGGERKDLMNELQSLLRRNTLPNSNTILSGKFSDLILAQMPKETPSHPTLLTHSHLFSAPVDEKGTVNILSTLQRHPAGSCILNFETWGGAISDIAVNATAFPHRDTAFVVHAQADIRTAIEKTTKTKAMAEMREALEAQANGGVYVNYPDLQLKDWGDAYWGNNLAQLKKIKNDRDPTNFFTHAHSISNA